MDEQIKFKLNGPISQEHKDALKRKMDLANTTLQKLLSADTYENLRISMLEIEELMSSQQLNEPDVLEDIMEEEPPAEWKGASELIPD